MKKFFKNVILWILIISFVLNIVNLIGQIIYKNVVIIPSIPTLVESLGEIQLGSLEEKEGFLAAIYYVWGRGAIEIPLVILTVSVLSGIFIALIVTFDEGKSKFKIFLTFIAGLLLVSFVQTFIVFIFNMATENLILNFIQEMIFNIQITWKWYSLIYVLLYTIKLCINTKQAKMLNELLNEKISN